MIGRTLGHYQVSEKLGEGGMGVVYRALDTHLNRSVVLKVIRADQMADPDRRRRFVQEARAASALDNPHIVKVHDIGVVDGLEFIVMEHVPGQPLDFVIPSSGMRPEVVVRYGVQICEALDAAHAAGIVHRDLKPGNIMITPAGVVKLLDFGLAKLTDDWSGDEITGPKTAIGSIIGTVCYMSPEQATGKPIDGRSDVFSLGAILYEMATGRRAFGTGSALVALTSVLRDQPPAPSSVNHMIPTELEAVITRCLAKAPDQRFPSARAVMDALASVKLPGGETPVGTAELVRDGLAALESCSIVGIRRARGLFEEALICDPEDPRIFEGVAECYAAMALLGVRDPSDAVPKAIWAADKAGSESGSARLTVALLSANCRHKWNELPPAQSLRDVRRRAFWYLRPLGRFDEAMSALEGRRDLQSWIALESGRTEEAVWLALQAPADSWIAAWVQAWAAVAFGRVPQAIARCEAGLLLEPGNPWLRSALAAAQALAGERDRAAGFLSQPHWHPPSAAIPVLIAGGETERAVSAAFDAVAQRDPGVFTAVRLPVSEPLRRHIRYPELLRRLGLPVR